MNTEYTPINQTMANLYAIAKTWYEIREKNLSIEDMKTIFDDLVLQKGSLLETARKGRNVMAVLKDKYIGFGEAT